MTNRMNLTSKFNKLGKFLGKPFKSILTVLGAENYKKKNGLTGTGYRLIADNGYTVRINFNKGTKPIVNFDIINADSIDLWNINDINKFNCPTLSIELYKHSNVLDIWDYIIKTFIRSNKIHEDQWDISQIPVKNGVRQYYKNATLNKRMTFIDEHPEIQRKYVGAKVQIWTDILDSLNLTDEWKQFNQKLTIIKTANKYCKEDNTYNSNFEQFNYDVKSDNADEHDVFKKLDVGLDLLLRSPMQRSMIIVGEPGTGKTHTVCTYLENVLGSIGDKWEYAVLSRITDRQLYEFLYVNRNKILVFDEASAFLSGNKNSVQDMLKSTLQTSKLTNAEKQEFYGEMAKRRKDKSVLPIRTLQKDDPFHSNLVYYRTRNTHKFINPNDETEIIEYCKKLDKFIASGGITGYEEFKHGETIAMAFPERFFFNGKIIFISNDRLKDVHPAIADRSYVVDIQLSPNDMIQRIRTVACELFDRSDVDTVLSAMQSSNKRISLRTFFSAINAYATNPEGDYWKIAATL